MLDHSLVPAIAPDLSYEALCTQLKPGDVLAFSGCDIPSTVVKIATCSQYVHVAIVLAILPEQHPEDPILIAESHIDTSLPSLGTGEQRLGVQIHWLSQRLATCEGPVWWAALKTSLSHEGIAHMHEWLTQLEQQQIPYDFIQAVGAGLDALDHLGLENISDDSALFCSELVTRALQLAGVVDDSINSSEQTPLDVMQFSCFKEPVLIQL